MEPKYFTRLRGRIHGPFAAEQLKARAKNGKFGRHYEVSVDQKNWEPASKHPELFPDAELPKAPVQIEAKTSVKEQEFYYAIEEEQIGPVKLSQLEDLVRQGTLEANTLVWTDGFSEWVAVEDIPALEPLLQPPVATGLDSAHSTQSALATWSLVTGLLGGTFCLVLASPLAIILGHMALSKIRASGGVLGGRKAAIAGLVLGYLVLISALVVAIVFAVLALMQRGND